MSWNPSPTLYGANWSGNTQVATRNQLLSSIAGIYTDLQDLSGFEFQNIKASTISVQNWISSPQGFFSTITANNIDISGIAIDPSGVFVANELSSSKAYIDFVLLSSLSFQFNPTINVEFNVKEALFGILAGLGTLLFQTFLGLGAGAGAAFQGIGNGIAAMIMANGSHNTYINTNNFELIGGSTQLQVSTLGNAYPVYSSIMRYVSSVAPNQVPGQPEFISTFFYPGQICIRSISDPFPLLTNNVNVNTSTLQQFGEWVPFEGLEPENIVANGISTNFISAGQAFAQIGEVQDLLSYSILTSNLGIGINASFDYGAGAIFQTGSLGQAGIFGFINQLNIQANDPIVFSQLGDPGTQPPCASLQLGPQLNQSYLQVSSIYMTGGLTANTSYISSLLVNDLLVLSTFSTIYQIEAYNVLSTNIVEANLVSTTNLQAKYVWPFQFSSLAGNPVGTFDITKDFTSSGLTYNSISSFTNNIMKYTMNFAVQDEPTFNMGTRYTLDPTNNQQWASTMLICNPENGNPGFLGISYPGAWNASQIHNGTFDLKVDMSQRGFYFSCVQPATPQGTGGSNFITLTPNTGNVYTYRFTLDPSGWFVPVTPAGPPYTTANNNTFTISQDINDVYISTTDRLNLIAGDINLIGNTHFQTIDVQDILTQNIQTSNFTAQFANFSTNYISSFSTGLVHASNIIVNPINGGALQSYYYKSTISWNAAPQSFTPVNLTFLNDTPNYLAQYTLLAPFIGNNYFTSYNASSWNNTVWYNTTAASLGAPKIYCGDLQSPLGPYAAKFYVNNVVSPPYALPVYYLNSNGSNLLGNITGGTIALIQTADGSNWTFTPNVTDPQGTAKATYNNNLYVQQQQQQTNVVNTLNLEVQAPNTTLITGTLGVYADQIRVNSHKYGTLPTAGLNSFPIGIEFGTYVDNGIAWTQNPPASGIWQSDATNVIYNPSGIFYDGNSWMAMIVPSRFRTNTFPIYSWDVQVTLIASPGGGYVWGYNRYIQVAAGASGPGGSTDNWNEYIMIPKNYCTY